MTEEEQAVLQAWRKDIEDDPTVKIIKTPVDLFMQMLDAAVELGELRDQHQKTKEYLLQRSAKGGLAEARTCVKAVELLEGRL